MEDDTEETQEDVQIMTEAVETGCRWINSNDIIPARTPDPFLRMITDTQDELRDETEPAYYFDEACNVKKEGRSEKATCMSDCL